MFSFCRLFQDITQTPTRLPKAVYLMVRFAVRVPANKSLPLPGSLNTYLLPVVGLNTLLGVKVSQR
ncbi:Uncharacterised protein [Salmonella enterica subsp. arizonae]|uniref:Uncharacterized protein n=1 Tax=Salmonella enterica subsp. arizonae TaxID=59203 RepID=A0A3S4K388_SALER|nr:Uncharacterised protein [Salmonella enterica subsp. arizonae]